MSKWAAIIILILVVAAAVIASAIFQPVAPILIPVGIACATLLFKPVREKLERSLTPNLPPANACRVYMYGVRGSGKTTIIKSLLSSGRLEQQKPTVNFEIYRAQITVDLATQKKVDLWFADYQGEKPSEVISDPPIDFIGSREEPLVNALFFVVDLVPRLFKGDGSIVASEDEMLEWLSQDFEQRVRDRVAEHLEYINKWVVEMLFDLLASAHLQTVFLLINKVDLIDRAYASSMPPDEVHDMFRHLFSKVEEDIHAACVANSIPYYEVAFVSARSDQGMRDVVNKVVEHNRLQVRPTT